jgi:hypothetical protein
MLNSKAEIAELRARGPVGLEQALARFDAAPATDRERLARVVDQVAGQRYATWSRLYWYTDFAQARAAAAAAKKPILALRMLGHLDEDYSCANSRFFRVALYANASVAERLRRDFVLFWSSERPVPRITVDFGDGRTMHGTIAGNSAHYLLDWRGRPVDVLPGLYGPERFLVALERGAQLAKKSGDLEGAKRTELLSTYHNARVAELEQEWQKDHVLDDLHLLTRLANGKYPAGHPQPSIEAAERIALSKSMVELPVVRATRLGRPLEVYRGDAELRRKVEKSPKWQAHLDASSRELLSAIGPTDWSAQPRPLEGGALDELVASFERQMAADQFFNEFALHFEIHFWFAEGKAGEDWLALNKRVYAALFLTPASDPWLGMASTGVFTGLPGDGIR